MLVARARRKYGNTCTRTVTVDIDSVGGYGCVLEVDSTYYVVDLDSSYMYR